MSGLLAKNWTIVGVAALALVAGVHFVRSQVTIGDEVWMKAMIPHRAIAILTSGRAHPGDPRVAELAEGIIETQRREIEEMKALLVDLNGGPEATPAVDGD